MTTIGFFNNKGGVGKTTLVFHLAHSFADKGISVLTVDLDPQSNLTAMFLAEERLEEIWPETDEHAQTVLGCIRPIMRGIGDITDAHIESIRNNLALIPGDLGLSSFEDKLSTNWPLAVDRDEAAFRALSAFHRMIESAVDTTSSEIVLVDVGPNLGAINRSALLSCDYFVTPVAPDLFSVQGLRNLGPTLHDWRVGWADRLTRNPEPGLSLPRGRIQPAGYVVMQAGMRLSRPVKAYERWVQRMPVEYHRSVLEEAVGDAMPLEQDGWKLGTMRHYQSLMPLAQDARKPMFHLKSADGAIGAHMDSVLRCREDFDRLASSIQRRISKSLAPI
jgi:chromosome partitioning protein